MSNFVPWIAAEAESRDLTGEAAASMNLEDLRTDGLPAVAFPELDLRKDNFDKPAQLSNHAQRECEANSYWDRDPDLWMYRKKTAALLRRYMRWSLEAGRLPSLLGRELFRAKITAFTATTFEDRVIFIHDMERCLEQLASFDREIIARVVLQEYEHPQAARILHCARRTIARRLPEVLDELTEAFLKARLLEPLPEVRQEAP